MTDPDPGLHPVHERLLNPDSGSTSPPPGAPPLPLPSVTPVMVKGGSTPEPAEPSGGGGYRFSPEQLENILTQWKELRDDLESDLEKAARLTRTEPPGNEFASADFVKKANSSGEAYYDLHERMLKYVDQYIAKLEKAKQTIGEAEDNAAQTATQAGAGLE